MRSRLLILTLATVGPAYRNGAAEEVTVSHCYKGDSVAAINDRVEPQSSVDRPRHSFWPHKGTTEWVEYSFDEPRKLSGTEIYWLLRGRVEIEVAEEDYCLVAGDALVVNPGAVHAVKPGGRPFLCGVIQANCGGAADKFVC